MSAIRDKKEEILVEEMVVVMKRGAQLKELVPDLDEAVIDDQVEEILRGKIWSFLTEEF